MNRKGTIRVAWGAILLIWCAPAALAQSIIAGSVRNQSRGAPAASDEVVLVRLDQGMQEESRTKTDARGMFSLTAQYPNKPYLVRVIHDKVEYVQRAPVGETLSIQVFDSAPGVRDVMGTIEILRVEKNGTLLHVSDMYEIANASNPPVTQAGERTFEVYLPANAKISSVMASGPEKIGVMISAIPVPGEAGHYSVNFPLRPGATKFAFNYDLLYEGHVAFRTRHEYQVQQMAVMIPVAMKFSSESGSFVSLAAGNDKYQVRAANRVSAGSGPEFEISGGLAPLRDQPKTQTRFQLPVAPSSVLPNSAISVVERSIPTSSKQLNPGVVSLTSRTEWLQRGTVGVLMATCALIFWKTLKAWQILKRPRTRFRVVVAKRNHSAQRPVATIADLKEALFQLETERITGSISVDKYASQRQALEETIQRAVAREPEADIKNLNRSPDDPPVLSEV